MAQIIRINEQYDSTYQIFKGTYVNDLASHYSGFKKFAAASNRRLFLQPDSTNPADAGKIQVLGICDVRFFFSTREKRIVLGQVPDELTQEITKFHLYDFIYPRLKAFVVRDKAGSQLDFDMLITKAKMREVVAIRNGPATKEQLDLLNYCSVSAPEDATFNAAHELIQSCDPSLAAEWHAISPLYASVANKGIVTSTGFQMMSYSLFREIMNELKSVAPEKELSQFTEEDVLRQAWKMNFSALQQQKSTP